MDPTVLQRFAALALPDHVTLVEYVWCGNLVHPRGLDMRSKTRTLNVRVQSLADIPNWQFDGTVLWVWEIRLSASLGGLYCSPLWAHTSLLSFPILFSTAGSSTGQAGSVRDSEVFLRPVRYFPDPFRRGTATYCPRRAL